MHRLILVVTDFRPIEDDELLAEKLAPWGDGRSRPRSKKNGQARFDWWQIGGRWSGYLDGYDPDGHPENQAVGLMGEPRPCWPIDRIWHPGDTQKLPLAALPKKLSEERPSGLVLLYGEPPAWIDAENSIPSEFQSVLKAMLLADQPGLYVTVLDIHVPSQ